MEDTAKKLKTTIDGIQKVVRGAIYFNSVFNENDFKIAIKNSVFELVKKFSIDKRFIETVQQQRDDILLCIMTLLHDSKFTFYDKNDARIFFCSYIDYNYEKTQEPDYNSVTDLYNNGVLALYISGKETMTFPLFVSDLSIKKYINYDLFMSNPNVSSMKKIPWTTAKRIDNSPAANSTFAIGGVSCSADSFVVAKSFVLRIMFSGKNPAHRQAPKRCVQP